MGRFCFVAYFVCLHFLETGCDLIQAGFMLSFVAKNDLKFFFIHFPSSTPISWDYRNTLPHWGGLVCFLIIVWMPQQQRSKTWELILFLHGVFQGLNSGCHCVSSNFTPLSHWPWSILDSITLPPQLILNSEQPCFSFPSAGIVPSTQISYILSECGQQCISLLLNSCSLSKFLAGKK